MSFHQPEILDLTTCNQSLEEIKGNLEKEVQEKISLINESVERLKELELLLNKTREESTTYKESQVNLQNELEDTRRSLQDKTTLIENIKQEFEKNTNLLNEELRKSKEMIEIIKREGVSEKDSLLAKYQQMIEEKDHSINVKTEELKNESKRFFEQQNILESLKANNTKCINELTESFKQQLHMKDCKIEEVSSQLNQKMSETEKLLTELSTQRELYKKKEEELISALQKLEGL